MHYSFIVITKPFKWLNCCRFPIKKIKFNRIEYVSDVLLISNLFQIECY